MEQTVTTEPCVTVKKRTAYRFVKRTFDIIVSFLGLIVCLPLFLVVAIAIKAEEPKGKILYHQPRIGLNGTTFSCHKFRSMYSNADEMKASLMDQNERDGPAFKIKKDPRVTKVGHIIRKYSVDELPQLWNVLVGEMSLVGPRPLPVSEELVCTPHQRQRELVKPGLTCYWQISQRGDLLFDEWIELDLKYIREQGVLVDMKIIFKTIGVIFHGGGY